MTEVDMKVEKDFMLDTLRTQVDDRVGQKGAEDQSLV